MTWLVLGMAAVVLVSWLVIYALATRAAVKSYGGPTPETAKIEAKTVEQARAIVNEGEADKREVLNADRNGLLSQLRDRVRPKR